MLDVHLDNLSSATVPTVAEIKATTNELYGGRFDCVALNCIDVCVLSITPHFIQKHGEG